MKGLYRMNNDVHPKKSLGQNFLKDSDYLKKIVDEAGLGPLDQVLEIGPGLGHLTRLIAEKAKRVLAIELDDRLISLLKKNLAGAPNVEIVHADALEYPFETLPGTWKLIANPPYYISTPIIQKAMNARQRFSRMVLMLQKELAERITSGPGTKEYGAMSVFVQMYAEASIAFYVPAGAFSPPPEVDSALVVFKMRGHPAVDVKDDTLLMQIVRTAFSKRRKTLRNTLKQLGISRTDMDEIEHESGIDLTRRPETLALAEFGKLSDSISRRRRT